MNERDERTMTQEQYRTQPEEQHLDGGAGLAQRTTAGGSMSTADMARAMERRSDGDGTAGAAAATARAGATRATAGASEYEDAEPLFPGDEAETFRTRWTDIQAGFVDEPRQAVERADELVAEVIQRLAQVFAEERQTLESQWGEGDAADTEGLRVALRRYRSFFERLLSA